MFCFRCGAYNPDIARFCVQCKNSLAEIQEWRASQGTTAQADGPSIQQVQQYPQQQNPQQLSRQQQFPQQAQQQLPQQQQYLQQVQQQVQQQQQYPQQVQKPVQQQVQQQVQEQVQQQVQQQYTRQIQQQYVQPVQQQYVQPVQQQYVLPVQQQYVRQVQQQYPQKVQQQYPQQVQQQYVQQVQYQYPQQVQQQYVQQVQHQYPQQVLQQYPLQQQYPPQLQQLQPQQLQLQQLQPQQLQPQQLQPQQLQPQQLQLQQLQPQQLQPQQLKPQQPHQLHYVQQYEQDSISQDPPPPYVSSNEASSVLLGPAGEQLPALDRLAMVFFNSLDQRVQPKNTGCLQPAKFKEFRVICGLEVPAYYESHVVPEYITYMDLETAQNTAKKVVAITFNGFKKLLAHKIAVDPNVAFVFLSKGLTTLGVRDIVLQRSDFPAEPDAGAVARDEVFVRQMIAKKEKADAKTKSDVNTALTVFKFIAAVHGVPVGMFSNN